MPCTTCLSRLNDNDMTQHATLKWAVWTQRTMRVIIIVIVITINTIIIIIGIIIVVIIIIVPWGLSWGSHSRWQCQGPRPQWLHSLCSAFGLRLIQSMCRVQLESHWQVAWPDVCHGYTAGWKGFGCCQHHQACINHASCKRSINQSINQFRLLGLKTHQGSQQTITGRILRMLSLNDTSYSLLFWKRQIWAIQIHHGQNSMVIWLYA